jgi:hypothetical protein
MQVHRLNVALLLLLLPPPQLLLGVWLHPWVR